MNELTHRRFIRIVSFVLEHKARAVELRLPSQDLYRPCYSEHRGRIYYNMHLREFRLRLRYCGKANAAIILQHCFNHCMAWQL